MENNQTEQPKIFFIRGFIRSGTNWVNNLLNLHPHIYAMGEFNFMPIKRKQNFLIHREWGLLSKRREDSFGDIFIEEFDKMIATTMRRVAAKSTNKQYKWIGDRSPTCMQPIILDGAPIFWIIRDVRDVIVSVTFHQLSLKHKETMFKDFPKMLKKKIKLQNDEHYFERNPHELLDDMRWVQHVATLWQRQMRDNIRIRDTIQAGRIQSPLYIIRYEDLHTDVERVRNEMYEFLGLDPKYAQPIPPLAQPGFNENSPHSHYRKGKVGDWKQYISEKAHKKIIAIAGEGMQQCGYSTEY